MPRATPKTRFEVLEYMKLYETDNHSMPSSLEIARALGICQTNVVRAIDKLTLAGHIERTKAGRLRIVGAQYIPPD